MKQQSDFDYTNLDGKDWLSPINVLELKAAVAKRDVSITLDGRMYRLRYHDDQGKVFVKVTDNFAPCGWFSYQELEQYDFEGDHDKHL